MPYNGGALQLMKIISRQQLIERVYERFDGALPKQVLYDALQAICENLGDRIAEDQSVSIHNFGTFHKYEFISRQTVDVNSGELRSTKPFINIRFVPDRAFSDLIKQKKLFFNKTID